MERTVNIYIDRELIHTFDHKIDDNISESEAYEKIVNYILSNIDIEME